MAEYKLELKGVCKSFPGVKAFQPPAAHRRGADRAVNQRRHESDGGAGHGGAGLASRQPGAFVRHFVLRRRGHVQAARHERHVRAGLSVAHALSQVR